MTIFANLFRNKYRKWIIAQNYFGNTKAFYKFAARIIERD